MITESAALGLVCTRARPVNDDGVARSTNIANGELHHMSLEDLRSYLRTGAGLPGPVSFSH